MSDPLREALEFYANPATYIERTLTVDGKPRGPFEIEVDLGSRARTALAASPAPAREWRTVAFANGRIRVCGIAHDTEARARDHAEMLRAEHDLVVVMAREVGPWVTHRPRKARAR